MSEGNLCSKFILWASASRSLMLLALLGLSCNASKMDPGPREAPPVEAATMADEASSSEASALAPLPANMQTPYPRGRWRLAAQGDLDRSVIWPSHILIRHSQAQNEHVNFSYVTWRSVDPPATRDRQQALALATSLASELAGNPESFAAVATKQSEDATTRAAGGSFGPVVVGQLVAWPQILDALEATPVGSVSEPVETQFGFHVLRLAPPPPEDTLTGSHIVIAHDDAPWLRTIQGDVPQRSRAAAMALAWQAYEQAREAPARFDELVQNHSDHRDAARLGDFGTWSTREPTFFGRELDALRGLQVGEVAPPIETVIGYQVIKRLPNPPRETYAIRGVHLLFDPNATDTDVAAPDSVLQQARQLAADVGGDAQRFSDAVKRFNQDGVEQWQAGRSNAELEAKVSALAVGEVAREPVLVANSYALVQRVQPGPVPPTLFGVPSPRDVDVPRIVGGKQAAAARSMLESCAEVMGEGLRAARQDSRYVGSYERWQSRFDHAPSLPVRVEAVSGLLSELRSLFGEDQFAAYSALLARHVESVVLQSLPEGSCQTLEPTL